MRLPTTLSFPAVLFQDYAYIFILGEKLTHKHTLILSHKGEKIIRERREKRCPNSGGNDNNQEQDIKIQQLITDMVMRNSIEIHNQTLFKINNTKRYEMVEEILLKNINSLFNQKQMKSG